MRFRKFIIVLIILFALGFGYYLLSNQKRVINTEYPSPSTQQPQNPEENISPTPHPNTQSAIQAFLANKYQRPLSEVHVTVQKEVQGYASGSVMFGNGGPGEGGMWLAYLGNGWQVVWDGNGNVDCDKMRTEYGFPDSILVPNFCN